MPPPFEATFESLNQHEVPDWFHDAKFGIFVHWTMSCIPAYAPQSGSLPDLIRDHPEDMMKYTPYAEWYWNTIKFPDSPAAQYHREKYGDAPYEEFRKPYEAGLNAWDPRALVDLIEASGAQYVVLVTKHHDGFVLWPTAVANPHLHGWNSERDVVGDFAEAVRARGMRFGVYYSGGLDWTFNRDPIVNFSEMMASVPRTPEYRAYVDAHYRELIARYEPSVLWNDIAYPPGPELPRLFADYYGAIPDGVAKTAGRRPASRGSRAPTISTFVRPNMRNTIRSASGSGNRRAASDTRTALRPTRTPPASSRPKHSCIRSSTRFRRTATCS